MSKLRTVAKILLMYCIFSSASAFAEGNTKGDPCLAFTCMAGKLQGNEATWGGKREPQKIPPFRIVEFFGGVVRGMTTRQRLPHLSEALWRDAETPGNSATPVPGPQ